MKKIKKTDLIKKNFYFAIVVVVLLFLISFVIAEYDPSQASHGTLYVDIIEPKSGGDVNIAGNLLINGQPFFGGYWTKSGNNIYYNDGNVGVGTTSPAVKLDVSGDIRSNGKLVCLTDGTNCPASSQGKWDGNKPGNIYYNDGNVGVGTASPLWKLHVNGAVMANGTLLVDGGDIGSWDGAPAPRSWMGRCDNDVCRLTEGGYIRDDFFFISGVTNTNYGHISDTNPNYRRVLGLFDEVLIPNGNLGVGVTSPQAKLHIVNNEFTGDDLRIEDKRDGNYAGIRLLSPDGGQATIDRFPSNYVSDPLKSALQISNTDQPNAKLRIQQPGDYPIVFHAGLGTPERMRIDGATGNVGIGTTNPVEKLQVNGTIVVGDQRVLDANATNIKVGDLASGDGLRALDIRAGDQTRIHITTDGNVGIGTTSPTEKLEVNGNIKATELIDGSRSVSRKLQYVACLAHPNAPLSKRMAAVYINDGNTADCNAICNGLSPSKNCYGAFYAAGAYGAVDAGATTGDLGYVQGCSYNFGYARTCCCAAP